MSKQLIILDKTCKQCNSVFKVKNFEFKKRIFCSKKCSGENRRTSAENKCQQCGVIFLLKKWESRTRLFCSRECSTKSVTLKKKKKCKFCNKEFEVRNHMFDSHIYCSRECSHKCPLKNVKKCKTESKIEKICITCNKKYTVWRYREKSNFCSVLCKHNHGRYFGKCVNCGCDFFEEKNIVEGNWLKRKYHCGICSKFVPSSSNSGFQLDVFSYVKEILNENRIKYNTHIRINGRKIWPDVLIDGKFIIECQGDYFHCNPKKYSPDYYNVKMQQKAKEIWEKDEERKNFLIDNGYHLLYIWENDWFEKKEVIKDIIKEKIYEIC